MCFYKVVCFVVLADVTENLTIIGVDLYANLSVDFVVDTIRLLRPLRILFVIAGVLYGDL